MTIAASALRIKGNAYFDEKLPSGLYVGIKQVVGTTKLEFKQSNKVDKLISKGRDDYGAVHAAIPSREPTEFTWTREEMDQSTLEMSMMGDSDVLTAAAGTLTAEAITGMKGICVQIRSNVTDLMNIVPGSVIVTDVAGPTTFEEGEDYDIDYPLGFLIAKPTGDIINGHDLRITCAYSSMAGYTVNAEVKSSYRGRLTVHGINMANDSQVLIRIPEVLIVSNSPIDFFTDKWVEFGFTGSTIKLPGEKSPYYVSNYIAQ